MHSEDAVARAAIALLVSVLAACTPRSSSSALDGDRAGRGRDRDASRTNDDEEDEREDLAASDAGISLRALSCTSDRECLTHRCDVEHKRCRFPCRDDGDCHAGAHCAVDAGELAACFASSPR